LTIFVQAKHVAMSHSPFIAFTQRPQMRSAFMGFWHLPPFLSILLRFRKNVYAFVYFGTHLRTFSAAMYAFASLNCILCHLGVEVCRWYPVPLSQVGLCQHAPGTFLQNIIFWKAGVFKKTFSFFAFSERRLFHIYMPLRTYEPAFSS